MAKASLKQSITNATRGDVYLYVDYIIHLYEQLKELADMMTSVYADLGIAGEFFIEGAQDTNYKKISMSHTVDLYKGREDELEAMSDDELHETSLTTDYLWIVRVNTEAAQFEFIHGDGDGVDMEIVLEDILPENVSDNFLIYPLTESGYQRLVCDLSVSLSKYIPMMAKLERLRRIDEQTGQHALKFD